MKTTNHRNLITGGAGFLGSHLIDKLMESGEDVVENSGILSSDYVPQCLREIGVPWLDIINAYEKAVEDPEDVRNAVDTMINGFSKHCRKLMLN